MLKNSARRRDPIRLTRRSGTWSLEFTRLVAVDEHLMRPERYRVIATQDNLRRASPSCPPVRLQEAEALMRQADDGSECVFELGGHGWAPVPQAGSQPEPARAVRELTAAISEMRGQLTLLRGLHDALLDRVVAIEALLPPKLPATPEPVAARPEPVSAGPRRVPSRRDMMALIQPSRGPKFELTLDGLREPEPQAAHAVTAATAADAPNVDDAAGFALPARAEVTECLEMLAADVPLRGANQLRIDDPSSLYMARLVDGAEETLAVILLDQHASAALGGALLGLPVPAREEQAARGLGDDTLEALNEVCNNLGGLLKRANPRVTAALHPLKLCDRGTVAWLEGARRTLDFVTPDGGVLRLAAR